MAPLSSTVSKLRPYSPSDREAVKGLLKGLWEMYPGGDQWLERCLTDVEKGGARCTIANVAEKLAGLAIETPKGDHFVKLSTLFIAPGFRGTGIGTQLVETLKSEWEKAGVQKVIASYDCTSIPSFGSFFKARGFHEVAIERNRYRPGYDAAIVEWDGAKAL